MKIHLVKHDTNGLGYAVEYENKGVWKVRFFDAMHLSLSFPLDTFERGDLKDLGAIDDTEENELFS